MSRKLTLAEAAESARCCADTIRRRVRSGELPASLVAGRYLIDESDLIAFMGRVKPAPKTAAAANASNA
jgi:excisionase family DNA binding protein